MVAWYNRTAFDVIGDLAFGESFHSLRDSKTHEWIPSLLETLRHRELASLFRMFHLSFLISYLTPKQLADGRRKNLGYAAKKAADRIKLGTERGDFWDNVMIKSENNYGVKEGMTRGEMLNNAVVLVLAGSETIATLLSGATYLLVKHPDKLQKVTTEVRKAYMSSDDIDLMNVGQLKYLCATIDESLRLYTPNPIMSARISLKGGVMVDGKFVPENTHVRIGQYAASRLEANFHRAEDFIPERWLNERNLIFDNDQRMVFQPFSVGPRNCIGRNLAYAEMRLILAKLLWNFDLTLDERKMEECGIENWLNQRAFTLWEKPPLWMKFTIRER
ncbi:MAG: hypothetical protein M1821_001742 [Bathelium mastoideum]|nr:MAG: hypothetical protein M1821_001742 [Bathelium mastoideum]